MYIGLYELQYIWMLFILLFNVTVNISGYKVKWLDDSELERIWKEFMTAFFNILFRHLSGGNEENHKNLSRVVGVPDEIRYGVLRNTSQARYCFSQFPLRTYVNTHIMCIYIVWYKSVQ
jgi:hypothetical protein